MRRSLPFLLPPAVLAGCLSAPPTLAPANPAGVRSLAGPMRLVVTFTDARARQATVLRPGWRVSAQAPSLLAVEVVVPAGGPAPEMLQREPGVRSVEPARRLRLEAPATPDLSLAGIDERRGEQWALDRIGIDAAWGVTTGSSRIRVAVIDTGIDASHPDLRDRVVRGRDLVNGDDDATDDHFHGTHCAGILAASRGNGGIVGVAPGVSLVPVKVLDAKGQGSLVHLAEGIVWAAEQRVPILSLSLGTDQASPLLEEAVKRARARGALVVAGAGNKGSEAPFFPAALPGVLAVGATGKDDVRATFSNYGSHLAVMAPGRDILSTIPGTAWARMAGTSMATPHVAGLAALMASTGPGLDATALRRRIEETAVDLGPPGRDDRHGHGRIDAARAMQRAAP